ncbi:hypothetical protein ACF0H5_021995 [Mactra antiquata]
MVIKFRISLICLAFCVLSVQQCMSQVPMTNLVNQIWNNLNLTDSVDIPLIGDLMKQTQTEMLSRAEDVLSTITNNETRMFNVSEECLQDVEAWLAALSRTEYWALRMIDAMGKPPSGLQNYILHWPGNWEECLSVQANAFEDPIEQNGTSRQFGGKYCTATLPIKGIPPQMSGFSGIRIGVCVPDTCSNEDSKGLVNTLIDIIPLNLTSRIKLPIESTCQEKELEYSTKAIIVIVVCGIFGLIIIMATIYDIIIEMKQTKQSSEIQLNDGEDVEIKKIESRNGYESTGHTTMEGKLNSSYVISDNDGLSNGNGDINKSKPTTIEFSQTTYTPGTAGKVLLSFSVYTNAPKILNTNQPAGTLTAVNGIRFLSMTWVMLGHTYGFGTSTASNIATYGPDVMKRFTFQAIENATVSVDTFFTLSGLLVAYLSLKEMKKCGGPRKFRWGLYYFHRYWRLTPPYMLFLMLYVPTMKYWSNGPFWPQGGFDINECEDSWYLNLLYIGNFFGIERQCMGWSWYLNNDMQFYVISPIMLIPLFLSPILGGIVCIALILVNFISAGIISYNDGLKANFMLNTNQEAAFVDYYMVPWCRIGPYVVGFILGYILYKTECKPKLTKLTNTAGWIIATALSLMVLYGLYTSDGTEKLSTTTAAIYNATHRTVWGACVAWVIYACATGFGGPVNVLLSWKGIIPLSRLTYCAYLVHPVVMYLYIGSQRSLQYWFDLGVTYQFLGHLCVTYGVAFVISLAFESPMMGLEKVLLGRKKNS